MTTPVFGSFPDRLLSPAEILSWFRGHASAFRGPVGRGRLGDEIPSYVFGNGGPTALWYGFPDPGEGIGASALVLLAQRLLAGAVRGTWVVVPCLNLADQPGSPRAPASKQTLGVAEVDWCVAEPRPETEFLLSLLETYRPALIYAMHDESHGEAEIPASLGFSRRVPAAARLRELVTARGIPWNRDVHDPVMGEGCFCMPEVAPDWHNSTFSVAARHGLVFVCELGRYGRISERMMMEVALQAGLWLWEELAESGGGAAGN